MYSRDQSIEYEDRLDKTQLACSVPTYGSAIL